MADQILGFLGKFHFLSNFHEHESALIYIDGFSGQKIGCKNVEAAYQASKTINLTERLLIANSSNPSEAKKLGRKIKLRSDWDEVKNDIMMELLVQKFTYPFYRELLLSTKDAYLEETNTWSDFYWGVCNGVGENHLGKRLMKIREGLK